jgi:EAL domain-containing protein (putative c-di-GMP-specific phosphodiesterase class I)
LCAATRGVYWRTTRPNIRSPCSSAAPIQESWRPRRASAPLRDGTTEREHFELMLRLRDEGGRLVAPAEFFPAAERYNVMPAIDRWGVRTALESVVYRKGNVVYFLRELKSRGCRFALDDFGSGLSSFMYLKTLPVDYLKIDGQFIENVTNDPVDRSMVEAISQVGRAMGIQTVAERVESSEVLAELGRLGIGYAQGFFVAPPASIQGFPYLRAYEGLRRLG